MRFEEMTDVQIIDCIRTDDEEAMEFLLKKYRGMVRKETRALYLIGGDDEDLIQEGMIGLFKAIRDYKVEENKDFALFANICIRRQIYNAITASNRKKHIPLNTYISLYAPSSPDSIEEGFGEQVGDLYRNPEEHIIAKERVDELWKRIDKRLSSLERKVLDLYLNGDSYEMIAEKLGKSKKSIDNAVQRIRGKLMPEKNEK